MIKDSESFDSERVRIGVAFTQGGQDEMRDRFSVELNSDYLDFGTADFVTIADGYGIHGDTVALFVATNLNSLVQTALLPQGRISMQTTSSGSNSFKGRNGRGSGRPATAQHWVPSKRKHLLEAIEEACLNLDDKLRDAAFDMDCCGHIFDNCGATCCGMWVKERKAYCCNVGDCRIVMSHRGRAVMITEDHLASTPSEKQRIVRSGGLMANNKINGVLATSRSFGMFTFKNNTFNKRLQQCVISQPDIYIVDADSNVDFIILASSILWKILTNQQAVDFVSSRLLDDNLPLDIIALQLVEFCETQMFANSVKGNITCLIVTTKSNKPGVAKLVRRPVRGTRKRYHHHHPCCHPCCC